MAISLLDDAAAACARLETQADDRALHDFRVALRRLRSTLQAYRDHIDHCVPAKLLRKARKLARTTNVARDSEVQADWLRAIRAQIRPHERPGYQWLVRTIDARVRAAYQDMRADDIPARFRKFDARLRRRLSGAARKRESESFGPVLRQRLQDAAAELDVHLQRIHSPADEIEAHQARIAAKRLRYLLEPVSGWVPRGAQAVQALKQLQDLLGEIHDTQVMEKTLVYLVQIAAAEKAKCLMELTLDESGAPALALERRRAYRAGMLAVGALCRERRQALFAELHRRLASGEALEAVGAIRRLEQYPD
ncbi:MAG: CHAD domain-containing protein [Gammaproteobacteria bacterium]